MKTLYNYTPSGVCSKNISIELDQDGVVTNLSIERGCNGNSKGLSALAIGHRAEDLAERLAGITCDERHTSCPDQLSKALLLALDQMHSQSGSER